MSWLDEITQPDPPLVTAALFWHDAGMCVVPARADGSKAPFARWEEWQTNRPTRERVRSWLLSGSYDGVGVICGKVSGNLEMLELEGRAITEGRLEAYEQALADHGLLEVWQRVVAGYSEQTPSGGRHYLLRIEGDLRGNLKLASRPATDDELAEWKAKEHGKAAAKLSGDLLERRRLVIDRTTAEKCPQVLLETRAEGGFVIVAPSAGRTHPSGAGWVRLTGSPDTVATITADERDALYDIARLLDQMPERPTRTTTVDPLSTSSPASSGSSALGILGDEVRPGDDFNAKATWDQILVPHGWSLEGRSRDGQAWTRPGKDNGISATTGQNDGDNLYVFSSSTEFEVQKPYSKFAAYTLLEHGDDYKAAAKALRAAGYGTQHEARPLSSGTTAPPVPPVEVEQPAPDLLEAFWAARPELEHLRTFARARMCSPWAVFGVALMRVITAVPPFVVLPPIVGGHASLNSFIALVGRSGGGKGSSERCAADAIDVGEVYAATVGSGEGIPHLYAHREKGGIVRDRDAVMFTISEIDTLAALGSRQGATLLPQLRSAWSGEQLGFGYADPTKRIPIHAHTYRMTVSAGVQPARSGALLDDSDGGTPQRFLWFPTTDPHAPDVRPEAPAPLVWRAPRRWPTAGHHGLVEVVLPAVAEELVVSNRISILKGQGEALDGHALQARLKVAAGLALLSGRAVVDEDDWSLSGTVMAVSDATRATCVAHLAADKARAHLARSIGDGDRAVIVADRLHDAMRKRVANVIVRKLRKAGGPVAGGEIRRAITSADRAAFEDALDALEAAGQIQITDDSGRRSVTLKDGAKA